MLESGWDVCHAPSSLQYALPEKAAREQRAVVVAEEGDCLLIAVADLSNTDRSLPSRISVRHAPSDEDEGPHLNYYLNHRQAETGIGRKAVLSAAAGRPVHLVAAAPAEIAIALAICRGHGDVQALRWERFRALVADCGLGYLLADREQQVATNPGEQIEDRVSAVAAGLPDDWGPELLGLLEGMPHLSTGHAPFDPALCVLVPPAVRAEWDNRPIVPWGLEDGNLVLGCATMPDEKTLSAVAAWTGLRAHCVLCEAGALRAVIDAFRSIVAGRDRHARLRSRLDRVRDTSRAFLTELSFQFNHLSAAEDRHAHAVTRQTALPSELVAQRLQSADEARGSRTSGLQPDPAALGAIPPQLAQSLSILPLKKDQHSLILGIVAGREDAESIRRVIGLLTGSKVRLQAMREQHLRASLLHCYRKRCAQRPNRLPWHGRQTSSVAAAGDRGTVAGTADAAPPPQTTVPAHGLPYIRLEHYAIQPEVIKLIPGDTLRSHCAIPLRRDGHVLWVVLATPSENALQDLARAAGLTIRPLLASPESIRARLRLCDVSAHALTTYHTHPVIAYLQRQGRLGETNLLRILDTPGMAVDQALDAAALLDYEGFAALAAQLCGLPLAKLRQAGSLDSRAMVSGRHVRPAPWHDPVDPAVAAEIAPEEARALGMLLMRREPIGDSGDRLDNHHAPEDTPASCLVIAVADPCSPLIKAALAAPNYAPHRLVVAPRPDVLAAIARAQGRAQLGERLLLSGVISEQDLDCAVHYHRSSGVRLGQALIHLNIISQEQLAYFLAEQLDLPFVVLQDMKPDAELACCLPEDVERRLGILPLYEVGDVLLAATPDPLNTAALAEAEVRLGRSIEPMICTEVDFEAALELLYRDLYLTRSSSELATRTPEESAARVITRGQVVSLVVTAILALYLLWRVPLELGVALAAGCTLFYAAFSFYRGYLIYRALSHDFEVPVSVEELAELDESTLPIYTVLVPLYREASVLPTLIAGLARLDYPATKLDVKLLLEEDDRETLDVVAATNLPPYLHPVIVPAAQPRGKPKACNYGLIHACGEYVVIFDAEDVPEPDQLKKAVLAFRKVPAEVVCLQAKLSYYNANQNLLTRWFTIEYSMWFDLFLPGLDASRAPVPLGGTSNHFRTACLLEAGAWDPFNVTEDADLGIRLYRRGWRTAVIESTTYEEATSEVYNWIRQRSRWVKGYIQTYLVHMRHPMQLWRAIGGKAFFSFNMVVGGTFFGFLLNPILWCLTALWYVSHAHLIRDLFPGAVFYLSACSLLLGNTTFVYLNVAGCMRPGMYDKVKYAFLSPLYWALMSLAAWKGFLQLWTNPFYWEKTAHGQYRATPAAPVPVPAPNSAAQHGELHATPPCHW